MTEPDFIKSIEAHIDQQYPKYAPCRMRSMHWEYDLSALPSEIADRAEELIGKYGAAEQEDFNDLIERAMPPDGFLYVTIMHDRDRIGINVPVEVFRKPT